MAWKGLHITKPARISLADGQICVKQDEGEVRSALEDIAFIVIDTPQAALTSALVSAAMEAGVAIVFADGKHTPSGLTLPFHRHHRQGGIARLQMAAKGGLRKRLWQTIVRAKIDNQAAALELSGHADAATLKEIARHVAPDDPQNVEARAARFYWSRLFADFTREDEKDRRNKLLNYGYAVVRAGVARALVGSGFIPAFGLKHEGAANAFNLADDLVEPFRPFVDVLAAKTFGAGEKSADLSIDDRRAMAGALMLPAATANGAVTLLVAAEAASASLVRALEHETAGLLDLPALEKVP